MFGTRNVSEASHSEFDLFAQHSVFWILDFPDHGLLSLSSAKKEAAGTSNRVRGHRAGLRGMVIRRGTGSPKISWLTRSQGSTAT